MKYFAEDLPDTVTYYDKELNITGNIHLIKRSFSIRSHPEECVQLVSKTTSLHLQWQVLDHKSPFVLQEENPCYTWMQNVLKVAKRNQYSAIDYTRMSYCFPQKIDYIQLSKRKLHKNLPIALEWAKIPLIREIPDSRCRKNHSASPGTRALSMVTRPPALSILYFSVGWLGLCSLVNSIAWWKQA